MLFWRLRGAGILATAYFSVSVLISGPASLAQRTTAPASETAASYQVAPPSFLSEKCVSTTPLSRQILAEVFLEDSIDLPHQRLSATNCSSSFPNPLLREANLGHCRGDENCRNSEFRPFISSNPKAVSKKNSDGIFEIRERALGILREENACSAWYRQQEPDTAGVLTTLSFQMDPKGEAYIYENRGSNTHILNPWVARVMQAGGAYQTVALNAGGAFFRPSAYVRLTVPEGGPALSGGPRTLRVGPYLGGTPEARLTTILHELGHAIGLLEYDGAGAEEKSLHNTDLVLEHCQPQIVQASKRTLLPRQP